jgi:hypothetical protein
MTKNEFDVSSLMQRVNRIERANRRWRFASGFFLLILASSVTTTVLSQERIPPPDLRAKSVAAERFVLMDSGSVRGELSTRNGTPALELYDAAGKVIWSTSQRTETIKR